MDRHPLEVLISDFSWNRNAMVGNRTYQLRIWSLSHRVTASSYPAYTVYTYKPTWHRCFAKWRQFVFRDDGTVVADNHVSREICKGYIWIEGSGLKNISFYGYGYAAAIVIDPPSVPFVRFRSIPLWNHLYSAITRAVGMYTCIDVTARPSPYSFFFVPHWPRILYENPP